VQPASPELQPSKPLDPRPHPSSAIPQHLPFLTLILLLLVAFYAVQGPLRSWLSGRYRAEATFETAMDTILDEFVEPRSPGELVQGALKGMVSGLGDRHSHYLSPTENERQQETEAGTYAGIGVELAPRTDKALIARVYEGSPAARAGLKVGDEILTANGRDLASLKSLEKISSALRGRVGTTVALTVRRDSRQLEVSVTRGEIHRPVVQFRLLGDGIGYLLLLDFPNNVHVEIENAIRTLRGQGMRGLVFDLRDNKGGFLDEAVRIADLFIAEGVIVSTRGRHSRDDRAWRATPGGIAEGLPLVVLVDGETASAAEILAGALHDHGRARLVGTRTYGKAAVNRRFPLPDGSGLLITTGRYYLPKGEVIEGKGLQPDLVVEPLSAKEVKELPKGTLPPDRQLVEATRLLAQQLGAAK